MPETWLATPVPQADPLVRAIAARLHPALTLAPDDVLAHVTVLGPFLPMDRITAAIVANLRVVIATLPAFDYELVDVRGFEGGVVYLAPEPAARFRAMTERLMAEHPGVLPYQGRFDEVIPHVTVGVADERTPEAWLRAEAAALVRLRCHAGEVGLIEADEHTFATRHRFGLARSG